MNYNYLIVGAGLTGAVIGERISKVLGQKVLIIDKRDHIGGNCFDYKEDGITVHKYGPHVFHTNYEDVWEYLSQFTDWEPFFYRVRAIIDSKEVDLPFNLNSIYQIFPEKLANKYEELLIGLYGYGRKLTVMELFNDSNEDIKFLGKFIYEKVFSGYTQKQWGLKPEEIDKSILERVPVLISRDSSYFQDKYQAIPQNGYTQMINNILKQDNIDVLLNTDFQNIKGIQYDKLIFTGPIDEYFQFKFGKLPYRSLKFDFKKYNKEFYQSCAQINYPNNFDFTRIVEYKHYLRESSSKTIISFEYPQDYKYGKNEAYYPILNEKNKKLFNKYIEELHKLENVVIAGRLGQYKYFNMDQTVKNALDLFYDKIKL